MIWLLAHLLPPSPVSKLNRRHTNHTTGESLVLYKSFNTPWVIPLCSFLHGNYRHPFLVSTNFLGQKGRWRVYPRKLYPMEPSKTTENICTTWRKVPPRILLMKVNFCLFIDPYTVAFFTDGFLLRFPWRKVHRSPPPFYIIHSQGDFFKELCHKMYYFYWRP